MSMMSVDDEEPEETCIKYFELVKSEDVCPSPGEVSWGTSRRTARTLVHEGCYGSLAAIRTMEEAMLVKAAIEGNTNPGTGNFAGLNIGPLLGGMYDGSNWCWIDEAGGGCFSDASGTALNNAFVDWSPPSTPNGGDPDPNSSTLEPFLGYLEISDGTGQIWDDLRDLRSCNPTNPNSPNTCPFQSFLVQYDCCE